MSRKLNGFVCTWWDADDREVIDEATRVNEARNARGQHMLPMIRVHLLRTLFDQPSMAEVTFTTNPLLKSKVVRGLMVGGEFKPLTEENAKAAKAELMQRELKL